METSRRDIARFTAGGLIAGMLGLGATPSALAKTLEGSSAAELAPSILEYLTDLDKAVAELANTWKPDDPNYRADVYRQIMMNLSYSYFAFFHADPEHPDWSPLWNPVYLQQPNPDTLYLYAPIRGDLTYRVSGDRGTCHSVVITTQDNFSGFTDSVAAMGKINVFDVSKMEVGPNNELEIIFSGERPAGHTGNWAQIGPNNNTMMVRYISQDWTNERDPQLSIECLDPVPPKPRLDPEEIVERIRKMAMFPANMDRLFFKMQDDLKQRVGVNAFDVFVMPGVDFQAYWPAAFEFTPGEALIVETELPDVRPYWNLQINDPYFNIVEYVYRLSSTNGHFARPSSDGKFRAVVALEDPGVPNWLDPAGFTEGTLWGRWYDCSSTPKPSLKRVPFDKVRDYLPDDTPVVTPEERAEELSARVRACQRRRRW
jgi:hypothetical protein